MPAAGRAAGVVPVRAPGVAPMIKLTEMADTIDTMGRPPVRVPTYQGTPRTGSITPLAQRCATERVAGRPTAARLQHAAMDVCGVRHTRQWLQAADHFHDSVRP